jgi:hypothetical protein
MYCPDEKSSVTLIVMPAKIAASMAGNPSFGAGDLDEKVELAAALMQTARGCQRALGVVGQQRREPLAIPSRPRHPFARGSVGTFPRRLRVS